jgi:uncharacterized protein YggE
MNSMAKLLIGAAFAMALPQMALAQREESITLRTSEVKVDAAHPVIDLNVTSSVTSTPDVASFSTGVQTTSLKARDAIQKNSVKMQAVLAQLKAIGIAEKDIQTSALSLRRDVDYLPSGKTRFKGYTVGNEVIAKLRDLGRLGDVLDTLVSGGATEFDGPYFSLDNGTAASAQARDKAWAMALEQANYHARKAGFSSVQVVRVSESIRQSEAMEKVTTFGVMEAAEAAGDAASRPTPIATGEVTTTVSMAISFQMMR